MLGILHAVCRPSTHPLTITPTHPALFTQRVSEVVPSGARDRGLNRHHGTIHDHNAAGLLCRGPPDDRPACLHPDLRYLGHGDGPPGWCPPLPLHTHTPSLPSSIPAPPPPFSALSPPLALLFALLLRGKKQNKQNPTRVMKKGGIKYEGGTEF